MHKGLTGQLSGGCECFQPASLQSTLIPVTCLPQWINMSNKGWCMSACSTMMTEKIKMMHICRRAIFSWYKIVNRWRLERRETERAVYSCSTRAHAEVLHVHLHKHLHLATAELLSLKGILDSSEMRCLTHLNYCWIKLGAQPKLHNCAHAPLNQGPQDKRTQLFPETNTFMVLFGLECHLAVWCCSTEFPPQRQTTDAIYICVSTLCTYVLLW